MYYIFNQLHYQFNQFSLRKFTIFSRIISNPYFRSNFRSLKKSSKTRDIENNVIRALNLCPSYLRLKGTFRSRFMKFML